MTKRTNPWLSALAEVVDALRNDPILLVPAAMIVMGMALVAALVWGRV